MRLGLPPFPKTAGTAKEFRDWDLKLQSEYPFRYSLRKAIKSFFFPIQVFFRSIQNRIWQLRYRFVPKHKYTTIKLKRLEPGYYDTDTLIFYAAFELFEEFMQRQLTNPHHVWEYKEEDFEPWMDKDEVQKEMETRNAKWREMNEIYNWWVNEYPNREQSLPHFPVLPKQWGTLAPFNEDFENEEIMKEWHRVGKERQIQHDKWAEDDQQMLIRLVKVMPQLWD